MELNFQLKIFNIKYNHILYIDLQYVAKPVIVNTQCRLTSWAPSQITDNMICAGDADGGESTCSGDSGGPLIVAGANDVATIIGTTSFGPASSCGTKGLPAIYAYTIPFLDWITPKMGTAAAGY